MHGNVVPIAFPQLDIRPVPILVTIDDNAISRIRSNLNEAITQIEQLATSIQTFPELHVLAVGEMVGVYRQQYLESALKRNSWP